MERKRLFAVSSAGRSLLRVCLARLAVGVVTTALSAFAQLSIGPNLSSGQITCVNNVSPDPYESGESAWLLGNSRHPVPVAFNPLAGPWQAQLSGGGLLGQNQEVDLLDYIILSACLPLADWHETIATPNFVWSTDSDDTFYTVNGGAPQYVGISYSPDKTTLNIDLPDLPAGAKIVLHQEVQYMGAGSFDNNTTPVVFDQIVAVPEPSSVAVLGLGAVLALIPRRRR
jgi:hypothetical protein